MACCAQQEYETLERLYSTGGSKAVLGALPQRGRDVIKVIAHRRGVEWILHQPGKSRFSNEQVEAAVAEAPKILRPCPRPRVCANPAEILGCCESTIADRISAADHLRMSKDRARKLNTASELPTLGLPA